jgi:hypothetical protein
MSWRKKKCCVVLGEMKKMLNANVFSTVPLGEDDCSSNYDIATSSSLWVPLLCPKNITLVLSAQESHPFLKELCFFSLSQEFKCEIYTKVKIYKFISAFIYLYINGEYYILSQS